MDKSEIAFTIGKNIANLRNRLGLTQAGFAEKLGLSPSFISCVERGKRSIGIEHIYAIAHEFGVSYDEILAGQSPLDRTNILYKAIQSCPPELIPVIAEPTRSLIEGLTKVINND